MRRRDTRNYDAVLDGRPVTPTSPLHQVASFLDDVRLEAAAMPAPTARPALAAIFDGRRAVPQPTTVSIVRPRATARLRPVAALVAATAVSFGGLAAAGALPGPIQRASAQLGTHLGLGLPGAPQPSPTPAPTPVSPTLRTTPTTSATVPPSTTTTAPAQSAATSVPDDVPTAPALPVLPTIPAPTALPLPDLRGPIGPGGLRLPIDLLPRPTWHR